MITSAGGFHRYSVDNYLARATFRKMLYDQAQLVWSYVEAHQITHEKIYSDMAIDILEYVLRDMTGTDGQFYTAENADSVVPDNPAKISKVRSMSGNSGKSKLRWALKSPGFSRTTMALNWKETRQAIPEVSSATRTSSSYVIRSKKPAGCSANLQPK